MAAERGAEAPANKSTNSLHPGSGTESDEGGDRAACREKTRPPQEIGGLRAELGEATGLGG